MLSCVFAGILTKVTSATVSGSPDVNPTIMTSPGLKKPQAEREGATVEAAAGLCDGLLLTTVVGRLVGLLVGWVVGLRDGLFAGLLDG